MLTGKELERYIRDATDWNLNADGIMARLHYLGMGMLIGMHVYLYILEKVFYQ